jgi:hypothetical protein
MVHIGLVPHLLPPGEVITDLIKESARVLRKGGVLLFSDNNPASKTIQVQAVCITGAILFL